MNGIYLRRKKMEALLNILNEINEDIDFRKEQALIDDRLLDSFCLIRLITDLEDEFDITIQAVELTPENFNSVKSMWSMIQRLQEE